ncbi:MAG: zinc ABC transporter substrate-binding protein [Clostridia bacterium]|nr:zinc ABC transporter substrate-binding protein [Clostridia bacterium]
MIDTLEILFSQQFLIRALVVGVLISLCCALLGVSLVLKRFSMIGDGLSHVGFGAMAIAAAAGVAPLYFALPIVIIAAFLLLRMSENGKIKGDAAIALISTGALAVGVMVTSMTTGMNVDIYNYMFGSILTMSDSDVVISSVLSVVVIALFGIFYNEIFAVTFDESFAKATGTKTSVYNMLISALTAVTIVIGMKMMGALLISSLIIFPTVTSMRLCKSFKSVVLTGSCVSVICFLGGLLISIKYEAPTGASVVCVNIFFLAVFSLLKAVYAMNKSVLFKRFIAAIICTVSFAAFFAVMLTGESSVYKKEKTTVVATTFAQYDFARQIAGDRSEVIMLLAPGEESHTFEPTPEDIMRIQQCDVFVYGGGESDKWADNILKTVPESVNIIKMLGVVELYKTDHEHEGDGHSHGETEYDEHVWTSPVNAVKIVKAISEAIIEADRDNAEFYKENTANFTAELYELDSEFQKLLSENGGKSIIVGDRFPFRYFAERYSLSYYAAFPGCSAQAEVNPKTIADLIEKAKAENITTVFKVDLSKGSVAKTIAEAAGAKVETLYSCHVIADEDYKNGEGYISLMRHNLNVLSECFK